MNTGSEKKGFVKNYMSGFLRAAVVALLVMAQFIFIIWLALVLSSYGLVVYYVIEIICIISIIGLVNKKTNMSFKIAWLVVISVIPIAGFIMYLLWGSEHNTRRLRKNSVAHIEYARKFIRKDESVMQSFREDYGSYEKMARYMESQDFPLYSDNSMIYYPMGESVFEAVIEDLKKAEKFIFIEFFIVADGVLWERIKPILLEKAAAGVEIKFLYDDFGSMFRTDKLFWKELTDAGIEVAKFNPIHKYLAKLYMNYRTHQKIIIVDGNIGYTGGMNLADEYINEVVRFGKWKDNAVRVEGKAVFGLTTIFLQMWGVSVDEDVRDYNLYQPTAEFEHNNSYCQFIADGPANNPKNPIVAVIRQLIYNAKDYLYITTPYLILEDDLSDALVEAARSGIDVRVITPKIPDKKTVYQLTRYNYGKLLANGIKVYEYTPGFIHAKTIITNGCGIVGTMNLDFRSLYLHYECAAFMWNEDVIDTIKSDIIETIGVSEEITYDMWKNRPRHIKIIQHCLNLFSSLM